MKLGRVGILVCLGALCRPVSAQGAPAPAAPPTTAQAVAPAGPDAGLEAQREALRQVRAVYEGAIRENKIEALAPLLHDDFHGVMVTGRAVSGLGGLKQYWTDIRALMGDGGSYTTTLKPEASVFAGDLALARGTSDDVVVTGGGDEFRFTTHWTAVLQMVDGRWKIRQAHGSMDPVDNAFTRAFARRTLMWTLPLTGAICLGLGYAAARFLGGRASRQA